MIEIDGVILCPHCFAEQDEESAYCSECGKGGTIMKENSLPLNTMLMGRYITGEVFGKGSFGASYLAYDLILKRKVEVKEYYPETLSYRNPGSDDVQQYAGDRGKHFEEGRKRFAEDAKALATLGQKPGIAEIFDSFYQNNTAYYASEFLDGATLRDELNAYGGRMPWKRVMDVAQTLAEALSAAHDKRVWHGDIRPENVFISSDGQAKLVNFGGWVQAFKEESPKTSTVLVDSYASIEVLTKANLNASSDIYSMGAVIYHALTGIEPQNAIERLETDRLYPAVEAVRGLDCPSYFSDAIAKMLSIRPQDRYHNAAEVRKALKRPKNIHESRDIISKLQQQPGARASSKRVSEGLEDFVDMPAPPQKYVIRSRGASTASSFSSSRKKKRSFWAGGASIRASAPKTNDRTFIKTASKASDDGFLKPASKTTDNSFLKSLAKTSDDSFFDAEPETKEGGFLKTAFKPKESRALSSTDNLYGNSNARSKAKSGPKINFHTSARKVKKKPKLKPILFVSALFVMIFICCGAAAAVLYTFDVTAKEYTATIGGIHAQGLYTGKWRAFRPNGQGVFTIASTIGELKEGSQFSGSFSSGLLSGEGVLTTAEGDKYTGSFYRGMLEGKGRVVYSSGSVYEGDFRDGKPDGKGTLNTDKGLTYEGDFVKGVRSGQGSITWPNGDTYHGGIANGMRSGYGVYKYSDGSQYKGDFKDDMMHGAGELYGPDGKLIMKGNWSKGLFLEWPEE